MPKAELKVG